MKHKVLAQVSFSCNHCGSSNLRLVGAVKTEGEKTYLVCQCECKESVPLSIDAIVVKLYEIAPQKSPN